MDPELINPELGDDELLQRLNSETAKLPWRELESHFARGVVVRVAPEVDLIQVAMSFNRDDRHKVKALMDDSKIRVASDSDALRWTEQQPIFWAIVVAPWVLIQENGQAR